MTDTVPESTQTPGVVIFVAILNFISVAFFLLLAAISIAALVFGNVMGVYDFVTRQMTQYSQTPNVSHGLTAIFVLALFFCLGFGAFFAAIGVGLLKRKKLAWYFQIAMSVLGLLGFPIGTALNAIVLIFFFQAPVRGYFKV